MTIPCPGHRYKSGVNGDDGGSGELSPSPVMPDPALGQVPPGSFFPLASLKVKTMVKGWPFRSRRPVS
jgi:hypothetical protein